jgi:hypothetical protein
MRISCRIDFDPGSRERGIFGREMEEKIHFSSGYLFGQIWESNGE